MFDMTLRKSSPLRYAVLVATFYKALGAAEAKEATVQLMLCILTDLKDMSPTWQREHLASVLHQMVKVFTEIITVVQQVCLHLRSCHYVL